MFKPNPLQTSFGDCGPDCPGMCPYMDTNTSPHENGETTDNVASWSACSDLCRARTDCQFWTWCNENMGAWAFKCITMTNIPTTRTESNIISGGRNCAGAPQSPWQYTVYQTSNRYGGGSKVNTLASLGLDSVTDGQVNFFFGEYERPMM